MYKPINTIEDCDFFTQEEVACSCCGTYEPMSPVLLETIESLRRDLGFPLALSSGYRCPDHPAEAKKDKPGTHNLGLAVDILVSGGKAWALLNAAMMKTEINRVGIAQRGPMESRFIHIDIATEKQGFSAPRIWTY